MNEEQIEAHRAEFERQWSGEAEWLRSSASGLNENDIAVMKACRWSDYLRNATEGNDQNWVNRTDKPVL